MEYGYWSFPSPVHADVRIRSICEQQFHANAMVHILLRIELLFVGESVKGQINVMELGVQTYGQWVQVVINYVLFLIG